MIITSMITIVSFRRVSIMERFLFMPVRVLQDHQWYRLITSGFLHADAMHLIFNMFSMLFVGAYVEHILGSERMVPLYIAAIGIGNLATLALRQHQPYLRAVGASGGVSAMIGALICLMPEARFQIFPLPIPIAAWIYGIIFLVGSMVAMRRGADNIGHEAHLGGMIAGIVACAAYRPELVLSNGPYVGLLIAVPAVAWYVIFKRRWL